MLRAHIWIILITLLTGCATLPEQGVVLREKNYSLTEIRGAIVSISGEPRRISENQREIYSQFFTRRKDPKFDPQKSKERLYALFSVLGDRRPYDIRIEVIVERRRGEAYEHHTYDDQIAKKIAVELKTRLNQGRDGRSVIDEFRPF